MAWQPRAKLTHIVSSAEGDSHIASASSSGLPARISSGLTAKWERGMSSDEGEASSSHTTRVSTIGPRMTTSEASTISANDDGILNAPKRQ